MVELVIKVVVVVERVVCFKLWFVIILLHLLFTANPRDGKFLAFIDATRVATGFTVNLWSWSW